MEDPINIIYFLLGGAIAVFVFFKFREKRKRIIDNGIEVEGIIYEFDGISINDQASYPLIRFVTKEGLWITEKGDWTSTSLKEGVKVTVVYNSNDPKEFIYRTSYDWSDILTYLFLIAGVVSTCIGLWFAYQYLIS